MARATPFRHGSYPRRLRMVILRLKLLGSWVLGGVGLLCVCVCSHEGEGTACGGDVLQMGGRGSGRHLRHSGTQAGVDEAPSSKGKKKDAASSGPQRPEDVGQPVAVQEV